MFKQSIKIIMKESIKKDYQQMMEELFVVYYEQCPKAKIKYSIFDSSKNQGHIVLLDEWMEVIHFANYQGTYAIKFAIVRNEQEYFFDSYKDARKHNSMNEKQFNNYILSITI